MTAPLQKAIDLIGGQSSLAEKLKCTQSQISYWLHQAKKGVPAEYCIPIEQITQGKVRREQLRPDVFRGG